MLVLGSTAILVIYATCGKNLFYVGTTAIWEYGLMCPSDIWHYTHFNTDTEICVISSRPHQA